MQLGKPTIGSAQRLIKIIKQVKPDVIQGWMYHGNIAAQFYSFATGRKTPVLWSIHHSLHQLSGEKPLTQLIIRFGSWTSKYVDRVAYVSEKAKAQHEKLGYSQTNGCVVPNGFDTVKFQPSAEVRRKFRQKLNITDDTFFNWFSSTLQWNERSRQLHSCCWYFA